jgi:hypothetical protein
MNIETVRIIENFQTAGHTLVILGRAPGGPRAILRADGGWEEVTEQMANRDPGDYGIKLPEGALDAIVHEHLKVAAPSTATADHLADAAGVRDRLLGLVERIVDADIAREAR